MAKSVKARKRQIGRFRYNAKRSWSQNQSGTTHEVMSKKPPKLDVKEFWDKKKSVQVNCEKLGIIHNLNKAMKPTIKEDEHEEDTQERKSKDTPFVKKLMESSQKKKVDNLRMPPRAVEFVTYLLDSYGENYKAMALDERNYDQETWKQLRSKVNKFKNCTDQYAQYLKKRDLLPLS